MLLCDRIDDTKRLIKNQEAIGNFLKHHLWCWSYHSILELKFRQLEIISWEKCHFYIKTYFFFSSLHNSSVQYCLSLWQNMIYYLEVPVFPTQMLDFAKQMNYQRSSQFEFKMFIVGNTVDTYSNNSLIRDFYATTHFYGLGIQQRDMIFKSSFTYLCIVSRHLVFQVRFSDYLVNLQQ